MNRNLSVAEGIEILANTKLNPEQERLLEWAGFKTEEQKKDARLKYFFAEEEPNNSQKFFKQKKEVELSEDGKKVELADYSKDVINKFHLDENSVRNTAGQLRADKKPVEILAEAERKGLVKWDNITQSYVKIKKDERPKVVNKFG